MSRPQTGLQAILRFDEVLGKHRRGEALRLGPLATTRGAVSTELCEAVCRLDALRTVDDVIEAARARAESVAHPALAMPLLDFASVRVAEFAWARHSAPVRAWLRDIEVRDQESDALVSAPGGVLHVWPTGVDGRLDALRGWDMTACGVGITTKWRRVERGAWTRGAMPRCDRCASGALPADCHEPPDYPTLDPDGEQEVIGQIVGEFDSLPLDTADRWAAAARSEGVDDALRFAVATLAASMAVRQGERWFTRLLGRDYEQARQLASARCGGRALFDGTLASLADGHPAGIETQLVTQDDRHRVQLAPPSTIRRCVPALIERELEGCPF